MTRHRAALHAVLITTVLIAPGGCERRSDAVRASSDPAEPSAPGIDTGITVDRPMLRSIKVGAVAEHDTSDVLTLSGKVQFDEDHLSRVLAPLSGQIVDLHVTVGNPVRAGQMLCAISSREAGAAAGEQIEVRKDLDLAEKNAAMLQDLFDHEAASKIALQQAQNDLAKARARVARTAEALRVLGLREQDDLTRFNGRVPIRSVIAGVVIDRRVTDGQFVQSDSTPLMTVADLSTVWVVGDLFERDLRLVKIGQRATITTAAFPGESFQGRVNYISDSIDPASRTAKVRVSVANRDSRLKPEMFASIALAAGSHDRAITVPTSAIFVEEGRSYVFVEAGDGRFVRRAIDIAHGEGADRRVLSGLRIGDRIVVEGVLLLRQEEQQHAG